MALFELDQSDGYGARAALTCALLMLEKLETLNEQLAPELAQPLQMGIGIHRGDAIIGQMGPPKTPVLTALGDAVNTAARLESATKELDSPVVVSSDTLQAARIAPEIPVRDILLRGRSTQVAVATLDTKTLNVLLAVRG